MTGPATKSNNPIAIILFLAYLILFIALAIHPYARDVWFTENMTILPIVAILTIMYIRGSRFSTTAYILMSFLIFMHTIGGHYTFERVPFDFVNHLFGWKRNNYDRVAHTTVGFYAFAIAEFVESRAFVKNKAMALTFAICAIMAVAAAYEIFEWRYAVSSDPKAGIAVLGSQGDIWDAQEDMLCDTAGAVIAASFYLLLRWRSATAIPFSRPASVAAASK
jgi:putative membrane protein